MVWEIGATPEQVADEAEPRAGVAKQSLRGHNHYVQDVVLSLDGQYCLSGSWDATLRLWELKTGTTTRIFTGHTKDVLSVAFSVDNRQVRCLNGASRCMWRSPALHVPGCARAHSMAQHDSSRGVREPWGPAQ